MTVNPCFTGTTTYLLIHLFDHSPYTTCTLTRSPPIHTFICPSIHLSIYPSIHLYIYSLISFGSSWIFKSLDHLHVRYAIGRQHNSIYNFSGYVTRKRTFSEKIHPLAYRHIVDPQDFLDDYSKDKGYCVPTCISLSILLSDKTIFSTIPKKEVKTTNQLINFHSLLRKSC